MIDCLRSSCLVNLRGFAHLVAPGLVSTMVFACMVAKPVELVDRTEMRKTDCSGNSFVSCLCWLTATNSESAGSEEYLICLYTAFPFSRECNPRPSCTLRCPCGLDDLALQRSSCDNRLQALLRICLAVLWSQQLRPPHQHRQQHQLQL